MQEDNNDIKPEKKKKKRWLLKIIYFFIGFFILLDVFLFFFATPVLKTFLQEKIYERTEGLFSVDFEKISIEIGTRRLVLKGFELTPDTLVYNRLIKSGRTNAALYSISCSSIEFWRTSMYSILFKNRLSAHELKLVDPIIELKKLPKSDTLKAESRDFVHQDLYPAIADYFGEVSIRRINLENGKFLLNLNKDSISSTTHIGYISIKLYGFLLNKEEFLKRNKLFYSNDLQINIDNYKVNLSDNIHYIYANAVSISTKTSKLRAENVGMRPLNESKRFLGNINKNYFRILAPEIEFDNFNIYDLYFEKDIKIGQVSIDKPSIEIVNMLKKVKQKTNVYNKSLELDLSQLIEGSLNSILVDSFYVNNGSLKFYYNSWLNEPAYKANQISLNLANFDLHENSNNIKSKIFYADELTLRIDTFSTILPDRSHRLFINAIDISTIEKNIEASGISLAPTINSQSVNRLRVNIPKLNISGADFSMLYHNRVFNISNLTISPAAFKIRIAQKVKNENENETKKNPLSIITANFIKQLYIRNLHLIKSKFELTQVANDSVEFVYQGNADFELQRFLITPASFLTEDINLFYSDKFRLILNNYQQDLRDQTHILQSKSLEVSNIDSIIEITDFKIKPNEKPDTKLTFVARNKTFEIDLIQASIKGIDIDKAYNDSSLIANYISILRPNIRISSYKKKRAAAPVTTDYITDDFAHADSVPTSDTSSPDTFREILATYFSQIDVKALTVENANLSVTDIDSAGVNDLVMSGRLSARLNKFYFNPHITTLDKQISYSEDISFRIRDYFGKFFNKRYQLKVKQASFSSKDSLFSATLVRMFPTTENETSEQAMQLWTFYAPKIESRNIKIGELIDFNILNLGKLNMESPSLALTQKHPNLKKVAKSKKAGAKKSMGIDRIKFDEINVNNGVFGVLKGNFDFENLILNTKINLKVNKLEIDSSSFLDPKEFIDLLDATITLNDVHYQLPDSLHFLDLKKIEIKTLSKEVEGDSIKYYTIGNRFNRKRNFTLNEFFIPQFSLSGLEFGNFVLKRNIEADLLAIKQPDFQIITQKNQSTTPVKLSQLNLFEKINKQLNAIDIKNIDINDASVLHTNKELFNPVNSKYNRIYANITRLLIDSLHQNNEQLLNSEDISVMMDDYGFDFPNKLYRLEIKGPGFSTGRKSIFAKSVHLNPNIGREEHAKERQKEINLNYLKTGSVQARGVNFIKLLDDKQFIINNIDINNIQFHSYKNKQYPLDSMLKVIMPINYVLKSKQLIKIDSIKLHNSYVGHEVLGKNAIENGFIDFTNINGEIINVTNDKKAIENKEETVMKASGYLMDQSLLTVSFHFPLDSKYGEYFYGGTLDTFDMAGVNPLLENLLFVSIEDGKINKLNFSITANDDYAEGKMKMLYNNLKIDLISKKKSDSLMIEKRGLFSMVANSIIKDSNPKHKGGFTKEGRIYFERNIYKSFFNYWAFSILSGMQSTLGFRSKQLKERLKLEKGSEKYAKKSGRKTHRIDKKTSRKIENQIEKELKDEEKNRRKEERKNKKKNKDENNELSFIKPENQLKIVNS